MPLPPPRPMKRLNALSPDLVQFLLDEIDAVPELEALVLLADNTSHAWNVQDIVSRLYLPPKDVELILAKLLRREFISRDEKGQYRFDRSGSKGARLERLVEAYRENIALIARLVHSKGGPGIQEFARAFELKRER